ncbi:MAG: hypothetical protein LW822_01115 [Phycisphaeraceae bacterium]|nr:hypothetical protein [Phycisphaeraceae bacterium]
MLKQLTIASVLLLGLVAMPPATGAITTTTGQATATATTKGQARATATTAASTTAWVPQNGIETLPRGWNVQQQQNILGWTFQPAVNAKNDKVVGFLAECTDQGAIGLNVKLMFIERQPDDSWKSFGWQEANLTGAIHWVKGRLGNDTFARSVKFSCHTEQYNATLAVAPEAMVKGLFASDPTLALVEAVQQPEEVVEFLVDSGYKASPGLSPKLSRNDGQAFLNNLGTYAVNQAQYTLMPGSALVSGIIDFFDPYFCSCVQVAVVNMALGTPGPATLVSGPSPLLGGNACIYTWKRCLIWTDYYESGRTWLACSRCATGVQSTVCTLYEYTTTVEPCSPPPAAPTPPAPGDYWYLLQTSDCP